MLDPTSFDITQSLQQLQQQKDSEEFVVFIYEPSGAFIQVLSDDGLHVEAWADGVMKCSTTTNSINTVIEWFQFFREHPTDTTLYQMIERG